MKTTKDTEGSVQTVNIPCECGRTEHCADAAYCGNCGKELESADHDEWQIELEVEENTSNGVPDWAWYITWGIMLAGIIVEAITITMTLLQR